jgi:hypothetical protein
MEKSRARKNSMNPSHERNATMHKKRRRLVKGAQVDYRAAMAIEATDHPSLILART